MNVPNPQAYCGFCGFWKPVGDLQETGGEKADGSPELICWECLRKEQDEAAEDY